MHRSDKPTGMPNLLHRVMSAFGTKRTCKSCRSMSAFGGEADMAKAAALCPLLTPSRHKRG